MEVGGHFEAAGSAETAIPESSQAKSVWSERIFLFKFFKALFLGGAKALAWHPASIPSVRRAWSQFTAAICSDT